MDTATLVNEQIEEGERFVGHLKKNGIDVAVALWVLTTEEGLWFLYIASAIVDTDGVFEAHRRVSSELLSMHMRSLTFSDVRLIGSRNPIAVEAVAYQRSNLPTRFHGRKLGNIIIEEAYIYPS